MTEKLWDKAQKYRRCLLGSAGETCQYQID